MTKKSVIAALFSIPLFHQIDNLAAQHPRQHDEILCLSLVDVLLPLPVLELFYGCIYKIYRVWYYKDTVKRLTTDHGEI